MLVIFQRIYPQNWSPVFLLHIMYVYMQLIYLRLLFVDHPVRAAALFVSPLATLYNDRANNGRHDSLLNVPSLVILIRSPHSITE